MRFHAFIYRPEKSSEVLIKTNEYFDQNPATADRIEKFSWIYHGLHNAIPTTNENIFSGHNFPYVESWDEMQVSLSLCQFGFYKQAMCSLRSALELGLLSVYYNINDEGHNAVSTWLSSRDDRAANTPRLSDVWNILKQNSNIAKFQDKLDIHKRIQDLGYLHNYVHTKGHKFSNRIGLMKSNSQTFEETGLLKWIAAYEEVIVIVTTLHLLKYPTALVTYDFGGKFGIDIPAFPHMQSFQLDLINELFPSSFLPLLKDISSADQETIDFVEWLDSHPDMTESDIDNQIISYEKRDIEHGGIELYNKNQAVLYGGGNFENIPQNIKDRMASLSEWAALNGFLEPKFKFPKED